MDGEYLKTALDTARVYTAGIFRRLREHEYDPKLMKLYVVGGGGCLISRYRDGNINDPEYRREIIDAFVNSVYVYDDKLILTYNYKDGSQALTLQEVEAALSSDLTGMCPPKKEYKKDMFRENPDKIGVFCCPNAGISRCIFEDVKPLFSLWVRYRTPVQPNIRRRRTSQNLSAVLHFPRSKFCKRLRAFSISRKRSDQNSIFKVREVFALTNQLGTFFGNNKENFQKIFSTAFQGQKKPLSHHEDVIGAEIEKSPLISVSGLKSYEIIVCYRNLSAIAEFQTHFWRKLGVNWRKLWRKHRQF